MLSKTMRKNHCLFCCGFFGLVLDTSWWAPLPQHLGAVLAAQFTHLLGGSPAGGTAELCLSLDDFTSTFNPNELVDLLDDLDDLK